MFTQGQKCILKMLARKSGALYYVFFVYIASVVVDKCRRYIVLRELSNVIHTVRIHH